MSNTPSRESELDLLCNSDGGGWLPDASIVADGSLVRFNDCLVGQPSLGPDASHEYAAFDGHASIPSAVSKFIFKITRDQAICFTPTSERGLLQIACDDERTGLFSYRADDKGYIEPLYYVPSIVVLQQTVLSGTSGDPGTITCSVDVGGRIHIENRSNSHSRTFLVFIIGMQD